MLGSLIRSCYYSSAKRDSAAVYRGKGHTLELVQCQGETCLTECRSHRDLFWVFFPRQCKASSVPRASTPQPMPTKWLTVPPAATPSPFTPAISNTCYRLLIPWTLLVYSQSCKHAFGFLFFSAVPVRATLASGSRGLCCSTPPKLGHFLCSHFGLTCFPLCPLSALFLSLAASPGHITAHREMQVQGDEVLDESLRQQQMQCQVPRGFHSCKKRLISQRGFIKKPVEPVKNLEVCLRVRDFRSWSIYPIKED